MTKANWKEAPHDAETYEYYHGMTSPRFCKKGHFYSGGAWLRKGHPENWTILERRPRIIAWEDMREGMVVRCVEAVEYGNWYHIGEECTVGLGKNFEFGPMNDEGRVTRWPERYTFELVSEPEQDPQNWDVLIDSQEGGSEQEWTHTYNEENCYIKHNEPDEHGHVIIVVESEGYDVVLPDSLKPIKPTITKEQFELLEKARQYFDIEPKDFAKFMNDYEVK